MIDYSYYLINKIHPYRIRKSSLIPESEKEKIIEYFNSHRICEFCNEIYETHLISGIPACSKESCQNAKAARLQEIKKTRKKNNLEKYGNENYCNVEQRVKTRKNRSPEEKAATRAKTRATLLERYGSETYNNPSKNTQTKIEKYGSFENYQKHMSEKLIKANEGKDHSKANEKRAKIREERITADPDYINKQILKGKQTKLEKYGDENYVNIQKNKETKMVRYGDENYNNRQKANSTNIEKYGTAYPIQLEEFKEKQIQTNLKKFGARHPLQNSEIKQKFKKTNIEKYGCEFPLRRDHLRNIENYDNKEFWISEFGEDKGSMLYIDFNKAKDFFGIRADSTIKEKLESFELNYTRKIIKNKAQQNLFDAIQTPNKIFNSRTILKDKEIDIYLPDAKLAIEYNGLVFHSQGISTYEALNTPNFSQNYHLNKTQECAAKGIQLFHIFEGEDEDLWLSMIHNKLGINTKIYARKCIIKELKNASTRKFQNDNHIQGFCNASKCFGLFYNDKLMSIMTFSKPRFNKNYEYELIRFCTLKNYNIIGGASKLFKHFIKECNPKSVISYANLRFSNGSIYEKLGFTKIDQSPPNYFYFKNSTMLESRNKFQKHKLANLHYSGILPYYNENESEPQNMFANGYRRIFDCGNLVYGINF